MATSKKPSNSTNEFWSTQPVTQVGDSIEETGPIEVKEVKDVPTEPYAIASVLEWVVLDVTKDDDMDQLYELLANNYVEDDDAVFRFKYSKDFLRWALTPPGYFRDWHIGVRKKSDGKLLAFISGVPCSIRIGDVTHPQLCEINFLCVHKILRSKRLAPILIKEVTRRVNLRNIWQAVYTAGVAITKSVAKTQYFHRNLNPQKLVSIGFSRIPPQYNRFSKPMDAMKRNYAVADRPSHAGLRPMAPEDVHAVHALLTKESAKYKIAPDFTTADVAHWILPRSNFLYAFVIEDKDKNVTDFVSFYLLPSSVLGNSEYDELRAAYMYYYSANTLSLKALLSDALVLAKGQQVDVLNMLNIMNNQSIIGDLKFGPGDGYLHYYFYNWKFPTIQPDELGLVML